MTSLPYRQRRLGAPFKPYFGLSGTSSTRRAFFVIRREAEGAALRLFSCSHRILSSAGRKRL